jgi:hypothetical protein
MKVAEKLIIVFWFICGALAIYWSIKVHNMPPKLPCQVAEISPDFSHEDRQKCRIIRSHKL